MSNVICPNCQHENAAGSNFCANCGAKLAHVCPNCGETVDPSANFCANCGHALTQPPAREVKPAGGQPEWSAAKPQTMGKAYRPPPHLARKILRDRAAMSGERRTVTVLFVDAVGSTAIGEQLDPEEIYSLTQAATQHMMDAVHLYEGTVAGFRGDGILALFGAPIAHEDAARRAVGAALEMQRTLGDFAQEVEERLGVDLRFRVGLNTGRVVVGQIGDDLDIEFTAMGDTVNLGARLEAAAEPGSIYVSEHTYRAAQEFFDFEYVGPIAAKGVRGAVPAYKAIGERSVRTRLEVAAERGLTPYVGRQHELELLKRRLDQVKGGRGYVVLVSGEAGIGKSRLLLEFRRDSQEGVTWWEGQCISYGKNIPYQPIIDILKNAFHVEESDSEARVIQRMEDAVASWETAARTTLPYLKTLLSVDPGDPAILEMDPRERRAGIFDGLRALLLQESRRQPLVVVVEDLHWIDEQSEAALKVLVDAIAAARVLLILTYRPGHEHSLGERTYFDRLVLGELPPEQSAVLARNMLHQASLPQELTSLITGKGEGNPFYIEEVTKSLVERGVLQEQNGKYTLTQSIEGLHVPDTIQEIILSRIDRLEREAKAALQLASVIGREFTARLLERISDLQARLDEALAELKALELIYQEAYFPELSYMFKHALTQDVAYRTLLRERRRTLHCLIGSAIEELYADRLPEQLEMLAHHYFEGESWEKALEYLEKAGDKVASAYANQEALSYYARALEACEKIGPSALQKAVHVAQKRGLINLTIGNLPGAVADFDRMRVSAENLANRRLEGMALTLRGGIELMDHKPDAAETSLREALAVADEGFEDVRCFANMVLAQTFKNFGRHAEAKPFYKVASALAPAVDHPIINGWWRTVGSMWPHWEGRFDDALEIHRRFGGEEDIISTLDLDKRWMEALSLGGKGEYERSLDLLMQVLSACERVSDDIIRTRALNTVGWVYSELQDHRRAMEWNTRGVKDAQRVGFPNPEVESNARLNLGDNLMALGRLDEAESHFQHVEQIVRNPRPQDHFALWRYSQRLFHSYGELWLIRDRPDRALAYADECLELAENTESRKNIVKARRLRGQVFTAQGHLIQAEEELSIALEVAQRVGNPTQLWKTHAALGELYAAQERFDEAKNSYQDALEVIQGVAHALTDRTLRETFLASEAVQVITMKSERT